MKLIRKIQKYQLAKLIVGCSFANILPMYLQNLLVKKKAFTTIEL